MQKSKRNGMCAQGRAAARMYEISFIFLMLLININHVLYSYCFVFSSASVLVYLWVLCASMLTLNQSFESDYGKVSVHLIVVHTKYDYR